MSQDNIETTVKKKNAVRSLREQVFQNPVVLKELRSRMRGGRAFILITAYLVLLGGLVSFLFLGFYTSSRSPGSISNITQTMGKTVFGVVVGMELMMVCFVAPALTAGAISAERERQTYDLLRTTLLRGRALVFGKLVSALSFLLLLLVVAFPLQSLAFLFGGVAIEEVLIAFLILVITAITFSAIGLFISSFTKRILASTVISYVVANIVLFGIPIIIYLSLAFLGSFAFGSYINLTNTQELILEIGLLTIGWFFVSVNPLATAIATEIILIEEQSAFYMTIPLSNGWNFPIVSPWIGYVIFYLILSAMLILLSVRFVRQVEK